MRLAAFRAVSGFARGPVPRPGRRAEQSEAEDGAAMGVHAPGRLPHGFVAAIPMRRNMVIGAPAAPPGRDRRRRVRGRPRCPEGTPIHVRVAAAVDVGDEAGLRIGFEFEAQAGDGHPGNGFREVALDERAPRDGQRAMSLSCGLSGEQRAGRAEGEPVAVLGQHRVVRGSPVEFAPVQAAPVGQDELAVEAHRRARSSSRWRRAGRGR